MYKRQHQEPYHSKGLTEEPDETWDEVHQIVEALDTLSLIHIYTIPAMVNGDAEITFATSSKYKVPQAA